MKRNAFLTLLLLTLTTLIGCSAPSETSTTDFTTEALTPVTVYESVVLGTTCPVMSTHCTLVSDGTTPNLTAVTIVTPASAASFYNTTAKTATLLLSSTDYAAAIATINTPNRQTKITVTYDNDWPGTKKDLTGTPPYSVTLE